MGGRIRIHVDTAGGKITVGPVQISQDQTIEEVQARIYKWIQENEPDLAELWCHGVVLRINNEPISQTSEIFSAKSGICPCSLRTLPETTAVTPTTATAPMTTTTQVSETTKTTGDKNLEDDG